jgi:Ca-activated chloride channel family protein
VTIEFVEPRWLYLLAALLPLAVLLRPGRTAALTMATSDQGFGDATGRSWLQWVPLLLRIGSFAALIGALAGPQAVRVFEEPQVEGVGIALALDLSTSMWAEDMGARVSRLDVAKTTAMSFIDARDDDIGLVAFAGEALTRLPLTHDGYVVLDAVEQLQVGLLTDGTDIAGAIAAGAGLLEDAPHESKVLILVTDGAHNKAGVMPDLAARAAAAVGVTIYPVAIGQERGRDQNAMETVLTQAARITGGEYFQATDVNALNAIYEEIDERVQPSEATIQRVEATPYRWLLALIGLSLAVAAIALRGSPLGVLP